MTCYHSECNQDCCKRDDENNIIKCCYLKSGECILKEDKK